MSTATADLEALPPVHYLNVDYGWRSWLFTTDHKRIAWLYLLAITFFFFVGGLAATLMRLNLIEPQGWLVEPSTYNRLFTIHGLVMIFFFRPLDPGGSGQFSNSSDDRSARRRFPAVKSA
jgi:cytochrome c oxidase subunit I